MWYHVDVLSGFFRTHYQDTTTKYGTYINLSYFSTVNNIANHMKFTCSTIIFLLFWQMKSITQTSLLSEHVKFAVLMTPFAQFWCRILIKIARAKSKLVKLKTQIKCSRPKAMTRAFCSLIGRHRIYRSSQNVMAACYPILKLFYNHERILKMGQCLSRQDCIASNRRYCNDAILNVPDWWQNLQS